MRHHKYNPEFRFVVEPIDFNKYTKREVLQYCLGATMYMPGFKDFLAKIIEKSMPGLTSMVMCFEDACIEERLIEAEENTLNMLEEISTYLDSGRITYDDIPLIFCRVRTPEQFECFSSRLTKHHLKALAGFNFPKFNTANGEEYFSHLKKLNVEFNEILYGMPIIEDSAVAFKETRMQELLGIKAILDKYRDIVLQVRVGATDFSSCFGVRRGIDYTIYDIHTVRDCLTDILNVLERNNDYVISGPVWEYFGANVDMKFKELPKQDIQLSIINRIPILNDAVDGLLREVILDKANGFVGKTIIHPTHIKYVNGMQAITREEYQDACQILGATGGVIKSTNANKMNEVKPHQSWAKKIYNIAQVYGVIEDASCYIELFGVDD